MNTRVLLTPFNYLRLVDERGSRLIYQNMRMHIVLLISFSAPFILLHDANFLHKDGFVDKLGAFSSVLTGFYVAGLLAVAAFGQPETIDKPITVGPIILPRRRHFRAWFFGRKLDDSACDAEDSEDDRRLSRREYVCYLFGYLALASLIVTISSIIIVSASSAGINLRDAVWDVGSIQVTVKPDFFRALLVIAVSGYLSHLIITTCRALYYLTDRLYAKEPETLPRDDEEANDGKAPSAGST